MKLRISMFMLSLFVLGETVTRLVLVIERDSERITVQ